VDPYSFTFTLMIRIVSADLPTEVVEIPGLSLAECVDAAREMEKRELVKPEVAPLVQTVFPLR